VAELDAATAAAMEPLDAEPALQEAAAAVAAGMNAYDDDDALRGRRGIPPATAPAPAAAGAAQRRARVRGAYGPRAHRAAAAPDGRQRLRRARHRRGASGAAHRRCAAPPGRLAGRRGGGWAHVCDARLPRRRRGPPPTWRVFSKPLSRCGGSKAALALRAPQPLAGPPMSKTGAAALAAAAADAVLPR